MEGKAYILKMKDLAKIEKKETLMLPEEKRIRRSPQVLEDSDINKIIETIQDSKEIYPLTPLGNYLRFRDAAAILLLYSTGGRPQEILGIKWADVDFKKSELKVCPYHNKVRCDWPIPLNEVAKKTLTDYREYLEKHGLVREWVFWSTQTEKAIATPTFQKRFVKIITEAGMYNSDHYTRAGIRWPNLRLYSFRHSHLTHVYQKTGDIFAVKEVARHKNIESSGVYTHLNTQEKIDITSKPFKGKALSTVPLPKIQTVIDEVKSESLTVNNNYNMSVTNNINMLIQMQVATNEKLDRLVEVLSSVKNNNSNHKKEEESEEEGFSPTLKAKTILKNKG